MSFSKKFNCCFIHIPKVAGKSITQSIKKNDPETTTAPFVTHIKLIDAQKSERIIREYKQLYEDYQKLNNQQLQELLSPAKPTEKKRLGKSHD